MPRKTITTRRAPGKSSLTPAQLVARRKAQKLAAEGAKRYWAERRNAKRRQFLETVLPQHGGNSPVRFSGNPRDLADFLHRLSANFQGGGA